MKRLIICTIVLLMCTLSQSQNFNLSKYTNVTGLPQNYVYSIVQDHNGFIWIAMAEGLSRYDGISFTNFSTRDSLANDFVTKLLIDTDGRLWCGHGNGSFSVYENNRFTKVIVDEANAPIKDMCLDDKGNIWAVEQNKGLIKINPDKEVTTFFDRKKFGRRKYYSVNAVNSLTILVGCGDGLMVVKSEVNGELKAPQEVADIPSTNINCIVTARNGKEYWIGAEDEGIFRYSITNGSTKVELCTETCTIDEAKQIVVRSLYEDESGNLYIGTWGDGLRKWKYDTQKQKYIETLYLTEENGLGNNFISSITADREGIYWFATYGGGAVAWVNNYFAQYNLNDIGFQRNKVISSIIDGNDLWLGLSNGLIRMDIQCMSNFEYYDSNMGIPQGTAITAICFDKDNHTQYIATENNGVFFRPADAKKYSKFRYEVSSNTTEMVNDMAILNNKLYLATQGGFVVFDFETRQTRIFTTLDGLPHNNINFISVDGDGLIWIGPKDSGIAQFQNDEFIVHRLSDIPINVAGMTHDSTDRMWLATVNNGVLCTSNDSVVAIGRADGLEKNYCYGIAADGNDRIWVCHQPGLSCIDLNTGNIRTFNSTNGVGQEFTKAIPDTNGDLWFSSSSGVIRYMSEYDQRNSTPPILNFTKVLVSGKRHNASNAVKLPYPYDGSPAKFEFDFIGICMKDPQNVRYEYCLQPKGSYDEKWIPLGTQNHKEFDYLPDGAYTFYVRAFNSDGIISQKTLKIDITISAPFWKTVWFPFALIVIMTIIIRIVMKWRERKFKERQEELEAEVVRQTAMLSRQKTEIERKNNDITDSINYAKRIQRAILPSANSLLDFPFKSSFILFMPRDIVSGDFYWFNRYDNKILICCGDCTGHGVPGAFMSMIGTTILNDATRDPNMRTPSRILNKLDKEIKLTLNKNQSIETQDGMDCAIIEIDVETLEVKSAAARRPVYFLTKGRLTELKGTRRSIGDHRNGNEFVEKVTKLSVGDTIYLTSDGFSDQFGGESGEKYTAGALKRFIENISIEPLENQHTLLKEEFIQWKGNYEQIDDVIIMAIRL